MKDKKNIKRIAGCFVFITLLGSALGVSAEASSSLTSNTTSDYTVYADVLEKKIVQIDGKWYEIVFNRTTGKIISKKEIRH
jgi:hypothetical protein